MEKTLVIIKPCSIERELIGEIIQRFERKGLILCGMKMTQLTDDILNEHYAHLKDRPFFGRVKDSMKKTPVIVSCWKGVNAIEVVRNMTGATNGRNAAQGTIRGDFSMSTQENIIHTSDSPENAKTELARFFKNEEIFDYNHPYLNSLYASDEI